MKKLLGGIFSRQPPPASPPKDDGSARVSPTSPLSAAGGGDRRAGGGSIYKTGPRGSWSTFFAGNGAARSPPAAAAPVSAFPTSSKVFHQNLDMLMREVVGRMKPMIAKMADCHAANTELADLMGIADLAADKVEQHANAPSEVLRDYFASPEGLALCERAAFPSLLVDFMGKMRVFLLKQELERLQNDTGSDGAIAASSMERPLEFLMICVIAVASNVDLIEKYRCELPNLIALTAEEYPPSAAFIRDLATQALASVPDKNFSSALVWYLHDCSVVAKTVRLVANYVSATLTTRERAGTALQALTGTADTSESRQVEGNHPGTGAHDAVIAAVSDALGLSKSEVNSSSGTQSEPTDLGLGGPTGVDSAASISKPECFCLPSYSPLPGLKALVYVLHKTCRYSLVLLGEFQSSGGYTLLARILQSCDESDIATYLYLFSLLLPLGTGFSGVCGQDESMATVSTCGARNVNAFLAMRDVLLNSIIAFESDASGETAKIQGGSDKRGGEQLILQLLTAILHVYTSDYENFVNLEPKTQMLALVLTQLPWIAFPDGQIIVLRIVEYVCGAARPETVLPTDILSVLSSLFIKHAASETRDLIALRHESSGTSIDSTFDPSSPVDMDLDGPPGPSEDAPRTSQPASSPISLMLCSCITKIVRDSPLAHFKADLRSFGVLERGVYSFLSKIANALSAMPPSDVKEYLTRLEEHLDLWGLLVGCMLRNDRQACVEFRQLNMHHSLYVIVEALLSSGLLSSSAVLHEQGRNTFRMSVVATFVELASFHPSEDISEEDSTAETDLKILQAGIESDFSRLLGVLQSLRGSGEKQLILIEAVAQMLNGGAFVWVAWRESQGYEILISLLSSLDISDSNSDVDDIRYHIMDSVLGIYSATLDPQTADSSNLEYFRHEIGYPALASCLANSGVLVTARLPFVLNRIFELITGNTSPRNKIRNGHAVQMVFQLLPSLPVEEAINTLNRLLLKLLSNDEVGFSKKKQVSLLVTAGVFKWIADPPIMSILLDDEHPLKQPILAFLVELGKEELSISHLRDFMRIIGRGMPLLLANRYCSTSVEAETLLPKPEVGLSLLASILDSSSVPQTKVGTHVKTRMASGYVHVVNSTDRIWPPSSGYSFACWLRFPPSNSGLQAENTATKAKGGESSTSSQPEAYMPPSEEGSTVCVALCEGNLSVRLDGDDTERGNAYGVLVGAALTMFSSSESAARNENPLECLDVTAVARNSALDFYFWSHEKRYLARCQTPDDVEMWWRAMQQSESISNVTTRQKMAGDLDKSGDVLFVSPETGGGVSVEDEVDGCACILSVYSLEFSGCYVRIYFERGTGVLRVDTGSVNTGPNMNPTKRNSVVFKSVDIQLLRAAQDDISKSRDTSVPASASDAPSVREKPSQWHHFAFTHRKTVVGSSTLTLFVDGSEVATKKLSYPSAPTTGTLQAFVGKDIQLCGTYPALPWSVGPAWLTEDVLPGSAIACMFLLGPSFNGRFSGYAYRSIGDWPEALATAQLDRTTRRRVEVMRTAKRLQLPKLARSSRRTWNELVVESSSSSSILGTAGADTPSELAAIQKKDDNGGVSTGSNHTAHKDAHKTEAFQNFIKHDCAMATFGTEILQLLTSFKLADECVLFSLNTKFNIQSSTQVTTHTQIHYIGTEGSCPLDLAKLLPSVGGLTQVLFPLLENSWRAVELKVVLRLLARVVRRNSSCMAECLEANGYALVANLLCARSHLIDNIVLRGVMRLAVTGKLSSEGSSRAPIYTGTSETSSHSTNPSVSLPTIVDFAALTQVVLCAELRKQLHLSLQCQLLVYLIDLLAPSNPNALFNARQLRRADLLSWILVYLSELGSEKCSLDAVSSQQLRWCYPQFVDQRLDDVLQLVLSLLRAYLRVESHAEDIDSIAEVLLLSLSADAPQFGNSTIRLLLLQFLLHEVEQDATTSQTSRDQTVDNVAVTIVNAALYRPSPAGGKQKRKDKHGEGSMSASPMSILSPTGESTGANFFASGSTADEFDNVLLEVMARRESGPYSEVEALLSVRILLSLAQDFPGFAQQLFQPRLAQKFKRVLRLYSTDYSMYTPLLAYVSNIAIKDTKYHDLAWSTASFSIQQFALPTPSGFSGAEKVCLTQVWELLGSLMLYNAVIDTERARAINVTVIGQLSFQIEVSEAFFATICTSSSVVIRILVQLLVPTRQASRVDDEDGKENIPDDISAGEPDGAADRIEVQRRQQPRMSLQKALAALLTGRVSISSSASKSALAIACLDLMRVILSRLLFEKDECAAFMMFFLECLDHTIVQSGGVITLADGQKCWLALLVHVVKVTKALSDNCTPVSFKNISTLAVALARYLVDEAKHGCPLDPGSDENVRSLEGAEPETAATALVPPRPHVLREDSAVSSVSGIGGSGSYNCFGTDVLLFFFSSVRMCSEPHIAQVIGGDDQQFFYSTLVYCTQTVVLSEFHGSHKGISPPQRLLDCLTSSRQLLLQQTKCSGVIVCGTPVNYHHASSGGGSGSAESGGPGGGSASSASAPSSTTGLAGHLNRIRNPLSSSSGHKEFGVGSESDRSFILSLASELFLMLVNDSESVRHASIVLWQYIMQQRMGVLKELMIVEPRVSLLQNMTASRKEVVDVFHGGFERLLQITTPSRVNLTPGMPAVSPATVLGPAESELSRESWLQFHLWMTEQFELLKELILVRTEPIYLHLIDVLTSCLTIRKVAAGSSSNGGGGASTSMSAARPKELLLNVDFTLYFDRDTCAKPIKYSAALDDIDVGYKLVARRAMVKYSNMGQAELASMSDGLSRWQEQRLRLAHTRSIWQFGGWQSVIGQITSPSSDGFQESEETKASGSGSHPSSLFSTERSIFQQNAFRYRLDFTEGPQRMRIRLIRNYVGTSGATAAVDAKLNKHDGEQKHTLRAVLSGHTQEESPMSSATPVTASPATVINEVYARAAQFHEAVDVYREYRYKYHADRKGSGAVTLGAELDSSSGAALLESIIRRCKLESTRRIFEDLLSTVARDSVISPVLVARTVFNTFLKDQVASAEHDPTETQPKHCHLLNVSPSLIDDIARSLTEAEEKPSLVAEEDGFVVSGSLQSTLFDAADAEAMQNAICASRSTAGVAGANTSVEGERGELSPPSASDDEDNDEANDEQQEDRGDMTGGELDIEGEEDDENGQDGQGEDQQQHAAVGSDSDKSGMKVESCGEERDISLRKTSRLTSGRKAGKGQERGGHGGRDTGIDIAEAEGSETNQHIGDEAVFDGSCDFVYGSIARFLQRDDYPPLRCYNAAYIAGMTRFPGIFVLGRGALYFIGGYCKLFNAPADGTSTPGVSGAAAGVSSLFTGGSNPPGGPSALSPIGKSGSSTSGSKKKAKDIIRTTLADWGTPFASLNKSSESQLFTIAPISSDPQEGNAPQSLTPGALTPLTTAAALLSSKSWSIKYSSVKQFCRMKYQLRPVGIEFFDTFGATFFVQFESHAQREEVLKLVFQMPIFNSIFWTPLLRSSALSMSVKRIRQALTKRWLRGVISNFEYLMHLNTLAGRSFNDLTQYPVFPWVVSDYTSEFLDLDNPESFRDLSKPMGALHEHRAVQFHERYNAMRHDMIADDENHHMMAAFHYGTHYSCSAYVVNYLIRLEPYSKLAKELQGGDFDHADRLFRSIPSSWESASRENLQDVRELIPEFYYLPEFLYNANAYALGTTQSGEVVNHVKLPTWAHGDPREFVRVHRQALESRVVSEHLHEWIDLVFGVKQTGPAALAALNVFMPITYEGVVDIDAIKDPMMRAATLAQIENFGQTPSKIFTSPHPARKVPVLVGGGVSGGGGGGGNIKLGTLESPTLSSADQQDLDSPSIGLAPTGNTLSSVETYVKWHTPLAPALVSIGKDYVFLKKIMAAKILEGPIGDIVIVNDKFHCRGQGCRFVPPRYSKYVDWGGTGSTTTTLPGASSSTHNSTLGDGTIKLRVHQTSARYREANKVIGMIEGAHFYKVNCVALSDDGGVLVTGGEDAAVNVLECTKAGPNGGSSGGQRVFKQLAKLVGHEDAVVSVAINKIFNLVVSGSADSGAILWDLRTRAFMRELAGHALPVDKVSINGANGNIITASAIEMRVWSINGDLLAAVPSVQNLGLSSITSTISTRCESWQPGVVAVTGHANGTIALWGLSYPSDLARDKNTAGKTSASSAGSSRTAVRVGRADGATTLGHSDSTNGLQFSPSTAGTTSTAKPAVLKVVPSCQLFVMKLLMDHRAGVTALTLSIDQRQLLSGDADGNCIRWVDDSVSVNIL